MRTTLIAFTLNLLTILSFAQSSQGLSIITTFSPDWIILMNSAKVPQLGLTMGVTGQFNFPNRIAIETGLQYSRFAEEVNTGQIDIRDPNDPAFQSGTILKFSYNSLAIPLKGYYYFILGKTNAYSVLGLALNYSLNYQTFSPDVRLGIGMERELIERIAIRIEPMIRSSLSSTEDMGFFNHRRISFGLNIGIKLKI